MFILIAGTAGLPLSYNFQVVTRKESCNSLSGNGLQLRGNPFHARNDLFPGKTGAPCVYIQLAETQSRNPVGTTCAVVTDLSLYGYNCAMGRCVSLIPVEKPYSIAHVCRPETPRGVVCLCVCVCFFVLCNRHRFNRVPHPPPRDAALLAHAG